jgi:hypothetical protein
MRSFLNTEKGKNEIIKNPKQNTTTNNQTNDQNPPLFTLEVDNKELDRIIKEHRIVEIKEEPPYMKPNITKLAPLKCHSTNNIDLLLEFSFKETKTDGERIALINSPINKKTQSKFQKKQNITKYWEVVNRKIKEENVSLFMNLKSLRMPNPKKGIKFTLQKANLPPWTTTMISRTTYNLRNECDKFWIKNYKNNCKIFTLAQGKQFSRKEFTKYCWNRKDSNIIVTWNSIILKDNWEKHALQPQENISKFGKLRFILNMYVNVCKQDIFLHNYTTLIEINLQEYIDGIEALDRTATLLYTQVLVNNNWEYYFFGLNTVDWPNAQWINFVIISFITFSFVIN